jgi:hypothetical protein
LGSWVLGFLGHGQYDLNRSKLVLLAEPPNITFQFSSTLCRSLCGAAQEHYGDALDKKYGFAANICQSRIGHYFFAPEVTIGRATSIPMPVPLVANRAQTNSINDGHCGLRSKLLRQKKQEAGHGFIFNFVSVPNSRLSQIG